MPTNKKSTKQAGLKEIAKATGLSMMTVSRVLNQSGPVSTEAKILVEKTATKLKYRPNLLVHGIRTGKTQTIGVMIPAYDLFDRYIITGIHDQLVAADHVPLLLWSNHGDQGATELEQIHRMLDRRVDAVIIKPKDDAVYDDYFRQVWERNIPLVVVDRELSNTHADFVGTDVSLGIQMAVEHLLSLGHRHLTFLGLDEQVVTYHQRRVSFEQATSGKDGVQGVVRQCEPTDLMDSGATITVLEKYLQEYPTDKAIVCPQDLMAVNLCKAAKNCGRIIPQHLSVTGYGGMDILKWIEPALTTIYQNPYRIGQEAGRVAIARATGKMPKNKPYKIRLKPQLIIRESTGKA